MPRTRGQTRSPNHKGFTLLEIIIATVLLTIGVIALSQAFSTGMLASTDTENVDLALNIAQAKMEELTFPTLIPEERVSRRSNYPSWGRNPFVAKETQTATSGKLILDGIAWDEKTPRAAINNRIVTIGDQVGGSTVVEILKDRVILNDGAGNFELRLGRRK